MSRAERCPLDELDVPAAPPALALAAGQVLVSARPTAALLAVAVRAHTGGLVAVGPRRKRLAVFVVLLSLFLDCDLVRDRFGGRMCHTRLRHVVERPGEFLTALETLAAFFRRRLPDDLHDR